VEKVGTSPLQHQAATSALESSPQDDSSAMADVADDLPRHVSSWASLVYSMQEGVSSDLPSAECSLPRHWVSPP